jgi:hypothetical protein
MQCSELQYVERMHGYARVMALHVMGHLSNDGCLSTYDTYMFIEEGGTIEEGGRHNKNWEQRK